jgi:hypothetical protein
MNYDDPPAMQKVSWCPQFTAPSFKERRLQDDFIDYGLRQGNDVVVSPRTQLSNTTISSILIQATSD